MINAAEIAQNVAVRVAGLPDRTSPGDWPEAMLVTAEELHLIVMEEIFEASPQAEGCEVTANAELPDDIRVPLHSLQADVGYLIGRVQADGSCGSAIATSIKERLSAIEMGIDRLRAPPLPVAPEEYATALQEIATLAGKFDDERHQGHAAVAMLGRIAQKALSAAPQPPAVGAATDVAQLLTDMAEFGVKAGIYTGVLIAYAEQRGIGFTHPTVGEVWAKHQSALDAAVAAETERITKLIEDRLAQARAAADGLVAEVDAQDVPSTKGQRMAATVLDARAAENLIILEAIRSSLGRKEGGDR